MKSKIYNLICLILLYLSVLAVPVTPASAVSCDTRPHAPVLITKNSDFTADNGVISDSECGTTADDPCLISGLQINDLCPNDLGPCGFGVKVDNSTGEINKFFNIQCIHSNFKKTPGDGATLIWIEDIDTSTRISDISGNPESGNRNGAPSTGVKLINDSYFTLANLELNRIGGDGIFIDSSHDITIVNSKAKAMGFGLNLKNSDHITVGSDPVSGGCTEYIEFTYNEKKGINIENSHDITVQCTTTSANDGGGIQLSGEGTYNVCLKYGTASGNGPICRTEDRKRVQTGVQDDTISGIGIFNGAGGDITITDYVIRANTHFDIMNGGDGKLPNVCNVLCEGGEFCDVSVSPPGDEDEVVNICNSSYGSQCDVSQCGGSFETNCMSNCM